MSIFAPITNFFTIIFDFLHDLIVNLGVDGNSGLSYVLAITLLTIIIRACLLPFNVKAAKSNQKMQEVQPQIKKIQEKYKNDPEKAQAELLKYYKENDVSMTGGCLPSLIPLPILMALYYVFYNMPAIEGKSFLWISDLGKPDSMYILPILAAVSTFLPSYLMSKATPSAAEGGMNMNVMNVMMALIMGLMAKNFNAILVIYWILGSLIQLVTTYFINYKPAKKKKDAENAVKEEKEKKKNENKFIMQDYPDTNKASKKKKKKK